MNSNVTLTAAERTDLRLDRALGAIFGCALGDAQGLPAEGNDKTILAARYPEGLTLPHLSPVRGFPLNDWTDDTDQTVLLMRAMSSPNPACDFATKLVGWFDHGFPELGDTGGAGCGGMTWRVLKRPEFTTDPFAAAAAIIGPKAGNGALMRTAPCAFAGDPVHWAAYMCRTTHSDTRCVASCIAQCVLIKELSEKMDARNDLTPEVARTALTLASTAAGLAQQHRTEMIEWATRSTNLTKLELDSRDARGYTFKTLACSFWALRQLLRSRVWDEALFRRALTELVMEGGDADTNAAAAGAVLGAALGYSRLPKSWLEALPNKAWLEKEVTEWYAQRHHYRADS